MEQNKLEIKINNSIYWIDYEEWKSLKQFMYETR